MSSPYYETTHIHTEYDKNNNVTRITETKTGAAGSLTDITDNSEYDQFDRLKTTTERGKTIHYDYDVNGNRTLVSSDAGSTTYSYDARNRLEWADQNTHKTEYSYYPDDRPDTVTFPNGTETVYTYYPVNNRVKTITNTVVLANSVISSFDYTYDPNGNRTKQIEVQNGVSETTDYSFDTMDRMTGYTLSGADTLITGYTFEGYNRKSETVIKNALLTTSREYTYNDVNWLTKIDDTTDKANPFTIDYAYDNNGNTIHKSDSSLTNQDITFTYDSRNQLVQVTRGPPASPELLGQYDYNADGLRVRHKNSERGNVNYYYDGNSVLEERSADTDTLLAHYRYADRLLSLDTGAEVQYYLNDALGSTVNLTTDVGSVKVSYWLDPYGEIRKQEGSSVNRMVFTGQEHDEKTGLIYFGARYYDPDTARFITQDSYLGEQGTPPSLDRYLYAYSNPTVYIDWMGYLSWKDFVINPAGASMEAAGIGLGYLGEKVDQGVDKYAPGAFMTGAATVAKTGIMVAKGIADTPKDIAKQSVEFVKDPTDLTKIPILGPVGTNLGVSAARFAEDQSFDNGVQLFGAASSAFLTVAPFLPKGPTISLRGGAVLKKALITIESRSGVGIRFRKILADETGSVGPGTGKIIARNKLRGSAAKEAGADVAVESGGNVVGVEVPEINPYTGYRAKAEALASKSISKFDYDAFQASADRIHSALDPVAAKMRTSTVTHGIDSSGNQIYTITSSSGSLTPKQIAIAKEIYGDSARFPQMAMRTRGGKIGVADHHGEAAGIRYTTGQTNRIQASYSAAKHGGKACENCNPLQHASGVKNVTGVQ